MKLVLIISMLLLGFVGTLQTTALSYTANKVWFEFLADGRYRVIVNYTVPALREFREAQVEFGNKKEAEAFYWDMVRGADFYPPHAKSRKFNNPPQKPEPW